MEFINNFDDQDIQFELDEADYKDCYISVYTMDTEEMRSLLTKDGSDPFEGKEEEIGPYAETYDINFYTHLYPYTGEIKIEVAFHADDTKLSSKIGAFIQKCDRVKDGFIQLSTSEKDMVREAAVKYLGENIREFFEMENTEIAATMTDGYRCVLVPETLTTEGIKGKVIYTSSPYDSVAVREYFKAGRSITVPYSDIEELKVSCIKEDDKEDIKRTMRERDAFVSDLIKTESSDLIVQKVLLEKSGERYIDATFLSTNGDKDEEGIPCVIPAYLPLIEQNDTKEDLRKMFFEDRFHYLSSSGKFLPETKVLYTDGDKLLETTIERGFDEDIFMKDKIKTFFKMALSSSENL